MYHLRIEGNGIRVKGAMDHLRNALVKQVLSYLNPLFCYPLDWIVVAGGCFLTDR
jgi:hypothetical protein